MNIPEEIKSWWCKTNKCNSLSFSESLAIWGWSQKVLILGTILFLLGFAAITSEVFIYKRDGYEFLWITGLGALILLMRYTPLLRLEPEKRFIIKMFMDDFKYLKKISLLTLGNRLKDFEYDSPELIKTMDVEAGEYQCRSNCAAYCLVGLRRIARKIEIIENEQQFAAKHNVHGLDTTKVDSLRDQINWTIDALKRFGLVYTDLSEVRRIIYDASGPGRLWSH